MGEKVLELHVRRKQLENEQRSAGSNEALLPLREVSPTIPFKEIACPKKGRAATSVQHLHALQNQQQVYKHRRSIVKTIEVVFQHSKLNLY